VPAGLPQRTGLARVPTLSHGDVWLSESQAIIEYLDEVFPAPGYPALLPADARARARARQLMSFVRTDVTVLRDEREFWMCVYPATVPPLTPRAEQQARELCALADHVLAAGDLATWSMGQVDLAMCLLRLDRTGYELSRGARRLLDAIVQRRAVRSYLERVRPPHPPPQRYSAG
jgi:glutathione S-transferase